MLNSRRSLIRSSNNARGISCTKVILMTYVKPRFLSVRHFVQIENKSASSPLPHLVLWSRDHSGPEYCAGETMVLLSSQVGTDCTLGVGERFETEDKAVMCT